jgi:hypothetical protein
MPKRREEEKPVLTNDQILNRLKVISSALGAEVK